MSSLEAKRQLVVAIEEERRRIGDELHDGLCQTLASTSILMDRIGRAVAANQPVAAETFKALEKVLVDAIDEARGLARKFQPGKFDGARLLGALGELGRENFVCEKPVFVSDPEKALALYRIAEEASESIRLEERGGMAVLTLKGRAVGTMRVRAEAAGATLEERDGMVVVTMPLLPEGDPGKPGGTA